MEKSSLLPPRHLLMLLLCSFALIAPALLFGAGGHDLQGQSIWVKTFSQQLWDGDLYPRWLQDMFAGRGSPVFFYYPPLNYYIAALFFWLAPLDAFAYYQISAGAWLAIFLSGITFYMWIKHETGEPGAALAASLLYMAAPQHVAIDFYNYLLPSTLWAYVWAPLLLWAAKETTIKSGPGTLLFAIVMCLLILTNIPQTVMWGPAAVAYGLLSGPKDYRTAAGRLTLAVALGFGLAAFYLFPMLSYRDYIILDVQWDALKLGGTLIDKTPYIFFLKTHLSTDEIWLGGFFLFTLFLLGIYFRRTPDSIQRKFFILTGCVALCLMIPLSMPLWKLFPLKILQFSERLFTLTSFSIAGLCAIAFPRLRRLSYGLIAVFTLTAYIVPYSDRLTPEKWQDKDPVTYRQYNLNIDQYTEYLTSAEMIPLYKGFEMYSSGFGKMALEHLEIESHPERVSVIAGNADVTVTQWNPRHIMLHYKASENSTFLIRQFMFPGFQASLNGTLLPLGRDEHTGQITIDVHAGEGDINLELAALMPEIIGKMVSLISAGCLLLGALYYLQQRKTIKTL